jgi:hypothetical protein
MPYFDAFPVFVLAVSLFLLLACLFAVAATKKIAAVLWCASASGASVLAVTFFSFWNNETQGNMFAVCIMVFMLCYSLMGASLCISKKAKHDHFAGDK